MDRGLLGWHGWQEWYSVRIRVIRAIRGQSFPSWRLVPLSVLFRTSRPSCLRGPISPVFHRHGGVIVRDKAFAPRIENPRLCASMANQSSPGLAWLAFALLTVATWG